MEGLQEIGQGGVLRHRHIERDGNGATDHLNYGACSLLDVVLHFLPKGWQDAAWTFGAITRLRAIQSAETLLRLILAYAWNDWSLRTTAARARRSGLAEVSDVAVLKRLHHASAWLGHLLDQWLRSQGISTALKSQFRLVPTDGSTIQRPGSHGTTWRLHAQWNLGTGQWEYVYSSRLTIDDLGSRLEDLEFECQQGIELGLMAAAGIGQTIADRLFERPKLGIIPPMEAVGLYKLPEPCDEVAVGGIRRQPEPGHREAFRLGHHSGMALITGVIQHEGDRQIRELLRQFFQERDHAVTVDGGVIGHRDDLVRDRGSGPEHVNALTPGGRRQQDPGKTPPGAQPGAQDNVRGIDEKDLAAPRLGLV